MLRAWLSLAAVAWLAVLSTGTGAELQKFPGHVLPATRRLTPVGRLDGTRQLNLAIGIAVRNQADLNSLLQSLYDPKSSNYRHYLTPAQFTAQFGPADADYQALAKWANSHGLKITGTHPNRIILDVQGAAADIESAFHIHFQVYNHPTEGRQFFAPDSEPSVDLALPLSHISGLDDYWRPHPNLVQVPAAEGTKSNSGSAGNGSYAGGDFRAAYVPGTTLTGAGQSVGLLEFDGYYANDISNYSTQFSLPAIPLVNVAIDGGLGSPGSNNGEVALDIEMVMAMAPGLSKIYVYEAPLSSPWVDLLSRMANDNLAKQLSCSWNGGGPNPSAETIFQQMAAQGQSFFCASGDLDAYTGSIPYPSDSPNVTEVGGTTLTTSGPGGSYISETVWNKGNGTGDGGGVSTSYTIPTWQAGVNMSASQGSTTMRNVPDVAMTANGVFVDYNNNSSATFAGTSCAAPLWAGLIALVNQQAVGTGQPTVGFLNPSLYNIGAYTTYSSYFHDITTGNNFSTTSPNKYAAVGGYDLCTGWGTPNGNALITALAGPSEALAVSYPAFAATGSPGGPFTPSSQTYTLTNNGTSSLNWSASNTQSWLKLSATGGTLASGASIQLTASINGSVASTLANGYYQDAIAVTDNTTSLTQNRNVALQVGQPDYFTQLFYPSGDNTSFQSWMFTPDGSASYYSVLRTASVTTFPTSTTGATALSETDDSYVQVNLTGGAQVSLYGASYSSFFVGSNGYITFNTGDSSYFETLGAHFNQPRISADFVDLNPGRSGTVSWQQLSDRVAVTWLNVPDNYDSKQNSCQVEMFYDGRIRITCLKISCPQGLIGLSQGLGIPSNYTASNFSTYPTTPLSTNATLANLSPSACTLSPSFASATTSYTASVSNATTSLTVTPTVADTTATVTVNGATVASGSASSPLNLAVGTNTITTVVTAQNRVTTDTYSVVVTRRTPYQDWATSLGMSGSALNPLGDFNSDGLANVLKWAYGFDSTSGNLGAIQVNGTVLQAHGLPTVLVQPNGAGGSSYSALFGVRENAASTGLSYALQFSSDLVNWTTSTATPTVVAQDNEIQAVVVPFPTLLNGQSSLFFRVVVTAQ